MEKHTVEEVIQVKDVGKIYKLYKKPQDRLKEVFDFKRNNRYTEFHALEKINFTVNRGETVGIVGTNGSGKSTLLKIITGVLQQTQGNINIKGRISALLELGAGFNQNYTGLQNIYLNGRIMGYTKKEMDSKVDDIINFAEIGEFINQPVKTYSSGMFARLAFAVAINVEPDILIVDEALSVGDLFFQNKCYKKFEELKERNVTILFVSHDISSVRQMCSRVLWIEKGKQILFDKSEIVCDKYMDHKRISMNQLNEVDDKEELNILETFKRSGTIRFPRISFNGSEIICKDILIISAFITNMNNRKVLSMEVEKEYCIHIVVSSKRDMENIIVGAVFENNKGIPLYDFNNYINCEKVLNVKKGEIYEVIFKFKLPRIMRGIYIMSAAIAQGSQENNKMLTWLHGVMQIEIVNRGYNSSYIEIASEVEVNQWDEEVVKIE